MAANSAKEIPDLFFLLAVEIICEYKGYWANRIELGRYLGEIGKVVLAKAHQLIKRGLLDGCDCNCRGDFELTSKGILLLLEKTDETAVPSAN
jgi:hypothetical protein